MTVLTVLKKLPQIGLELTLLTLLGFYLSESARSESFPATVPPLSNSVENNSDNQNSTSTLPESVTNAILQDAASVSGLPISDLKIDSIEGVTWPDGCMGVYRPDVKCTRALVEGWRVVVKSEEQQWVYHGSGSRFSLASGTNSTLIGDPPPPPTILPFWPSPVGASQENPILPTVTEPNLWSFDRVPRRLWYDPPTAYGFQYKMTSNSVFTDILGFPTNFKKPFAVLVKDIFLGKFTAGDRLNFSDYRTVLGDSLVGGQGVKQFSVTGINVDPTNPTAFPIQLDFNTSRGSFEMQAITSDRSSEKVPEPSSFLGCAVSGVFLTYALRKRRKSVLPVVR